MQKGCAMRIDKDFKEFCKRGQSKYFFINCISTLIFNPCFHCVCLFRLAGFFQKIRLSPLSKVIWYINRLLFNVDLDWRADIAGGFVLVHGLGTVIGRGVHSTGKLTVYQGVTLGGSYGRVKNEEGIERTMPLLNDDVIVYTGASIFGPVTIKAHTIIKAGQIVTSDI